MITVLISILKWQGKIVKMLSGATPPKRNDYEITNESFVILRSH